MLFKDNATSCLFHSINRKAVYQSRKWSILKSRVRDQRDKTWKGAAGNASRPWLVHKWDSSSEAGGFSETPVEVSQLLGASVQRRDNTCLVSKPLAMILLNTTEILLNTTAKFQYHPRPSFALRLFRCAEQLFFFSTAVENVALLRCG